MIIDVTNKESLILDNIIQTLSQIRLGGVPMAPLIIDSTSDTSIQVYFYSNAGMSNLLFTRDNSTHQELFTALQNKTSFAVPDEDINFTEDALSPYFCLSTYYTRIVVNGQTTQGTYNNRQNLLFKSVVVATKPDPVFSTNDDSAIIVPVSADEKPGKTNSHYSWILPAFDIYLQLTTPNLTGLSERVRVDTAFLATNVIRIALYKDANRGGNCTFFDSELNGTLVRQCNPLASGDMFFRGVIRVTTCYMASATTY